MKLQHGTQNAYQLSWCQIFLIHYTGDLSSVGSLLTLDRSPCMMLYNLGIWWITGGKRVAVMSSKLL